MGTHAGPKKVRSLSERSMLKLGQEDGVEKAREDGHGEAGRFV